jgi:A/G-specific adenine glycosylase
MELAARKAIRRRLLGWYDRRRRDLPWRRRAADPYAQLVAEFMLQQTQVSTVIPYYERFLQRFPNVTALAAASVDDVLALWSGLGYYSRARNLHTAAGKIVSGFGGRMPDTVSGLMSLPGVGRYTAGAVASIAYGVRAPVLDGNVARVLCRLFAVEESPSDSSVREWLWGLAEELLPPSRCGDFNQALMELGAMVCTPREPACQDCPLRPDCIARRTDRTAEIPAAKRKARVQSLDCAAAVVTCGGRVLLVRRPEDGLWGGLWSLPTEMVDAAASVARIVGAKTDAVGKTSAAAKADAADLQAPSAKRGDGRLGSIPSLRARGLRGSGNAEGIAAAQRRLQRALPSRVRLEPVDGPPVTRILTHRRITFYLYAGHAGKASSADPTAQRWVLPSELDGLGVSSACRALMTRAGWL